MAQSSILTSQELAFVAVNLKLLTDSQLTGSEVTAINELTQALTKQFEIEINEVFINRFKRAMYQRSIQVSTFEDYLEKKYNAQFWSETSLDDLSVSELIKMARPINLTTNNEQLQRKILAHEQARSNLMKDRLIKLLDKSIQVSGKIIEQIKENNDLGLETKPVPQRTSAYFRTLLEDRFNETFASEELILLKKLLISYFKNLPKDRLAEIAFEISKLPLRAEPFDVASCAILNSGPHLQKLLQLLARNPALPPSLRTIFEKLESGAKPIPWKKVSSTLEKQKIRWADFTYIERKPIGVGSMAQAHRAQYMTKDQKKKSAVIRILKPGIERLVKIDEKVLAQVAQELDNDSDLKKFNLPELSPLIEDISKSIAEELNVAQTVRNQNEGGRVYSKELVVAFDHQKNIVVVGAPSTFAPIGSTTVMIQDLVIGKKPAKEFDALKSIYPSLYRTVSEKLAEIWVAEAFFGTGFFHADLHQGNILALYTDSDISVQILDYGMVGRLSAKLRNSILLLSVGVQTQNAKLIASTLSNLSKSDMNDADYQRFLTKVSQRLINLGRGDSSALMTNSIEGWTAWALLEKIEFNYEFLKLNRAIKALESLLVDSGSPQSLQDIAKDVVMNYKARFSKIILSEPHLGAKDYALLLRELFPQKTEQIVKSKTAAQAVRCESLF